jgi:predicted DNA-binding transcriptional regulator YafY
MRADRLVAALLVLQVHGRITAKQLANELEVSVRTARRDLEALSMAGVPVYALRGNGGGWSLLGGARTDLTGLTAAEAHALFLVAGPTVHVDPSARRALRKLVQAMPEPFRTDARSAALAVVIDPDRWGGRRSDVPPHLDLVRQAIIDRRQVRLAYSDREGRLSQRTVHPLGLIQKGIAWYLAAGTESGTRTYRVDRIREAEAIDAQVVRPADFDLPTHWRSVVETVEKRRRRVRAVVHVGPERLPSLRAQFGEDMTTGPADDTGMVEVHIRGASAEGLANELAGWGADIEVVGPNSVRRWLARIGRELVEQYGTAPTILAGETRVSTTRRWNQA